jgi:menaquinone-dependent protoporphyrinogen IX oxidase
MGKAIIVYESKYGNTRKVAEQIAEGMRQVRGTEVILAEVTEADLSRIDAFDAILIGSPNHVGRAMGSIRTFIDTLGKQNLANKKVAVFDTYIAKNFEKALKKMEKQIKEKVPSLSLVAPGLSVRVDGMKGPVCEGELPKCREFGISIAKKI